MNVSRNDHRDDFHRGKMCFVVQMKLVRAQSAERACHGTYETFSDKSRKH